MSHISHVVADTDSWEQKLAQSLEDMEEVVSYVKNHNLGFTIPYTISGEERNYQPDFIVRLKLPENKNVIARSDSNEAISKDEIPRSTRNDRTGVFYDKFLNLIIEVTGERKKDKEAKVATAKNLWVPAVNNHGGFGIWAFLEIEDPWNAKNTIHNFLRGYLKA